jgi:hypothetical protein
MATPLSNEVKAWRPLWRPFEVRKIWTALGSLADSESDIIFEQMVIRCFNLLAKNPHPQPSGLTYTRISTRGERLLAS